MKTNYLTGHNLKIGDRFNFKNRKTIYIFEGYDDLDGCFVAWCPYNHEVIYFDEHRKVEKIEY